VFLTCLKRERRRQRRALIPNEKVEERQEREWAYIVWAHMPLSSERERGERKRQRESPESALLERSLHIIPLYNLTLLLLWAYYIVFDILYTYIIIPYIDILYTYYMTCSYYASHVCLWCYYCSISSYIIIIIIYAEGPESEARYAKTNCLFPLIIIIYYWVWEEVPAQSEEEVQRRHSLPEMPSRERWLLYMFHIAILIYYMSPSSWGKSIWLEHTYGCLQTLMI